ncbi:MAG: hypothetical protein V4638_12160 [Bacteroidota bacterium]
MKNSLIIVVILLVLTSCGDEKMNPKPPTYLRMDLPINGKSIDVVTQCGPKFQMSEFFTIEKTNKVEGNGACSFDIDLGKLNGKIYCFYYQLSTTDTLSKFINFANDKVDDHKVKATTINDFKILRPESKVFGTFFELEGDVATNFQFYLTDSSRHFFRAELLLNARPNYDSLKPTLDYIKKDLEKIYTSFRWN